MTGSQTTRNIPTSLSKSDMFKRKWNSSTSPRWSTSRRGPVFLNRRLPSCSSRLVGTQVVCIEVVRWACLFSQDKALWISSSRDREKSGTIRRPSIPSSRLVKVSKESVSRSRQSLKDSNKRERFTTCQRKSWTQSKNWRPSNRIFSTVQPKKISRSSKHFRRAWKTTLIPSKATSRISKRKSALRQSKKRRWHPPKNENWVNLCIFS